ncbi:Chaperone protein DnaJ [Diplonema papillatum]|nr:Chaperone protein DnaJ [Diplonema papillatum]
MGVQARKEVPPLDGSFYSKLGVGFSATLDDIRSAYKREALLHHPDRNAKDDCAAFQDIQEAYDVLRDERKRLGYDLTLKSKPKRRAPLKPRSMVRSPMLVACAGNVLRTIDIHESSFGMALRHGDMIETNVGRRGIVIGLFDSDVYWWPCGDSEGKKLGDREELVSPGVGGVTFKKIHYATPMSARGPPTSGGFSTARQRAGTPKKRPSKAVRDRVLLAGKEKARRGELEGGAMTDLAKLHMKIASEIDLRMYTESKKESQRRQGVTGTFFPTSPRLPRRGYAPSSSGLLTPRTGSFATPPALTPRKSSTPASSARPRTPRVLKTPRKGVCLRHCTPGIRATGLG